MGYRDWRALAVDLNRLRSWTGKRMNRIRGRLSGSGAWRAKISPSYRKSEQAQSETDLLRAEVELLQERVRQVEEFAKDTRWLELERRRDAYVRIGRKLAPDIIVADPRQPRILVTLKNEASGVTDDMNDVYFYLVAGAKSKKKDNASEWVADEKLSRLVSELIATDEVVGSHLQLGVVRLDGNEELLEVRWGDIKVERRANDVRCAILTIEDDLHFVRVVDTMKSIVTALKVNGPVAPSLAKRNELHPNTLGKMKDQADGG